MPTVLSVKFERMETITEFLRDPPTRFFSVEVVTGSFIGIYLLERVRVWRSRQRQHRVIKTTPDG